MNINWPELVAFAGILVPITAGLVFILDALIDRKLKRFLENLDGRYASREVTDIRIKSIERILDQQR